MHQKYIVFTSRKLYIVSFVLKHFIKNLFSVIAQNNLEVFRVFSKASVKWTVNLSIDLF